MEKGGMEAKETTGNKGEMGNNLGSETAPNSSACCSMPNS
jgi:hypothetical protein